MQSWGTDSRFSVRQTDLTPSKSGVIGLVAAAQGLRRTEPLTELTDLRFGVRADQPGRLLRDFQTARRDDGRGASISHRYYLNDAVFLAALQSDDREWLQRIRGYLRRPVFPLYLGRRSCPPSGPIPNEIFDGSIEEAFSVIPWCAGQAERKAQRHHAQVCIETRIDAAPGRSGTVRQRDIPVTFDPERREHRWREIDFGRVWLPNPEFRDDPNSAASSMGGSEPAPDADSHDVFAAMEGGEKMFLTRFQINPQRRGSGKLLASPQVMHAAVLAGFPGATTTDAGRVLWRVDTTGSQRLLIIASPTRPDLTHLVEQAGWPSLDQGWETRNYDSLLDRIADGQRWAFRLTANPTRTLAPAPGEKRGRVLAHRTVEHQLEWLNRQAERQGFSLVHQSLDRLSAASGEPVSVLSPTTRVSRSEVLRFEKGTHTVTLRTATFDGLLAVTGAQAFRRVLSNGIGSGRAYGCGLLTIAPFRGLIPENMSGSTA